MSRPEDALQIEIVKILRKLKQLGLLEFYAVRNEGKRTVWEQSNILHMGLRAGVPDLVILLPGGRTAYVELKAPKGVLSEKQKRWRDWLTANGFPWVMARSVDDFMAALASWGVCT